MKRIITTFCLMAVSTVTMATGESLARNSARGTESGRVQAKAGDPGQPPGKDNADPTEASDNFLNQSSWYLGLKGTVLPQAGLEIDKVIANSPADLAGLEPGMLIVSCNDIMIADEADILREMNASNGVLMLIVQLENGSQGQTVVEMVPVSSVSF